MSTIKSKSRARVAHHKREEGADEGRKKHGATGEKKKIELAALEVLSGDVEMEEEENAIEEGFPSQLSSPSPSPVVSGSDFEADSEAEGEEGEKEEDDEMKEYGTIEEDGVRKPGFGEEVYFIFLYTLISRWWRRPCSSSPPRPA